MLLLQMDVSTRCLAPDVSMSAWFAVKPAAVVALHTDIARSKGDGEKKWNNSRICIVYVFRFVLAVHWTAEYDECHICVSSGSLGCDYG